MLLAAFRMTASIAACLHAFVLQGSGTRTLHQLIAPPCRNNASRTTLLKAF